MSGRCLRISWSRGLEIPIGLVVIFLILFGLGFTNLFTKPIATEGGVTFTVILFGLFVFSERANKKIAASRSADLEKFNVYAQDNLTAEAIGCKTSETEVSRGARAKSSPAFAKMSRRKRSG